MAWFPFQEDKDTSSTKESLDDLFPTEDEEQSQSKTVQGFGSVFIRLLSHLKLQASFI